MSDRPRTGGAVLSDRIEGLRRARGLTVAQLAERADLDPAGLESMLAEMPDLGVSSLGRLAAALGVSAGDLLEGIEWVPDGHGGGEYRVADPVRPPDEA
jgi:transcriptional regulator with XRE-family HTH domain